MKTYQSFRIILVTILSLGFVGITNTLLHAQVKQLKIDGPANIRNGINGQLIDQLPNLFSVDLIRIKGNWAEISYQKNEQPKKGWTHLQNLPHPALLEGPTKVKEAKSRFLTFQFQDIEKISEEEIGQLRVSYKGLKTNVLDAEINLQTAYDAPSYVLMYTGRRDYPFLLYYSGQAGDMVNVSGSMVLFHPTTQANKPFMVEQGNRVNSQFVKWEGNSLTILESLYCFIRVETTFSITDNGIERISGQFRDSFQFPSKDELEYVDDQVKEMMTLESDLLLFPKRSSTVSEGQIFPMGTPVTIELIEVDFRKQMVCVKVNGKKGWLLLETFKELKLITDSISSGCHTG